MKKLTTSLAIAFLTIGSIFAQGRVVSNVEFASNPAKFNEQMITLNKVEIELVDNTKPAGHVHSAQAPGAAGATGMPSGPGGRGVAACNPPRSFVKLNVTIKEKPEYHGCFFMSEQMYKKILAANPDKSEASLNITFKGNITSGYMVSLYTVAK
jgi:hypothetical protein